MLIMAEEQEAVDGDWLGAACNQNKEGTVAVCSHGGGGAFGISILLALLGRSCLVLSRLRTWSDWLPGSSLISPIFCPDMPFTVELRISEICILKSPHYMRYLPIMTIMNYLRRSVMTVCWTSEQGAGSRAQADGDSTNRGFIIGRPVDTE